MKTGTLVLPLCDNDGVPVDAAHATLQAMLVDIFGGVTEMASKGVWRNAKGEIQHEAGRFYVFSGEALPGAFDNIVAYVGLCARQDAIYWSWDGVARVTQTHGGAR